MGRQELLAWLMQKLGMQHAPINAFVILRDKWLEYRNTHNQFPRTIFVSQELFNAYESQLMPMERFGPYEEEPMFGPRRLKFKAADVKVLHQLTGTDVIFE